jgi:predicted RNase H-like HicB family nuclease
MRCRVLIERDGIGMFVVEAPELPGCVSQGRDRSEAMANIQEASAASRDSLAVHGEPI